MASENEAIADIVAEFRDMVHRSVDGIIAVKADVIADRIEAAWKRERESLLTKQGENVNSGSAVYTGENKGGNAAAMREALETVRKYVKETTPDKVMLCVIEVWCDEALADPPRNCDRSECKDTTSAQLVWAKEDSGKTAYYEWLLAPVEEGAEA